MIDVAHGLESKPRVEGLSGDRRAEGQYRNVLYAREAIDFGHQQPADAARLDVGSDEHRTNDASFEARGSDDTVADGRNEDVARAHQLPERKRSEAQRDP